MHDLQITAGFSDIKLQLLKKTGLKKEIREFDLWFRFVTNQLTAHDSVDHDSNILLASFNPKTRNWTSFLVRGSLGEKVMTELLIRFNRKLLEQGFNDTYMMCAHLAVNRKRT